MERKKKDSFVVYYDWEECFSGLTLEQAGELTMAIFAYEKREETYSGGDPAVKMAMRFIQSSLNRNKARYEKICERNRKNIASRYQATTKATTGSSGIQNIPMDTKATDHDHDHDPDHDPDHDNAAIAALNRAAAANYETCGAMAYYMDRFSAQVSREAMSLIPFYAKEMGDDVVKAAVDEAINNRARSWTYVKAILMAWQKEGIRSMASLSRYMEERKRKKGAGKNANCGAAASNGKSHLPGEIVFE